MENFLEKKAEIFYRVRKHQEQLDNNEMTMDEYLDKVDVLSDEYNQLIHQIWKVLMKLEMTLYEQLEEAVQTFDHTLTEMINTFVENAQGFFTQMRTLESSYTENITECANRYLTTLNIERMEHEVEIPEEIKDVFNKTLFKIGFILTLSDYG